MKTILKIFVGIAAMLFSPGCSVYQHVTLKSNLQQNNMLGYLIENDSIAVVYSFNGQNGPIHIELSNKSDRPFYVDWQKSALITNGQSNSLWKDEAIISANSTEYKVLPESEIVSSTSSINGIIEKRDKKTFVPPHSSVSVNSYVLQSKFFTNPAQKSEKVTFYTAEGKTSARKFSFSKEDSPLNFRIFLSISRDDSFENPFQFDNSFWVSDYCETPVSPKALSVTPENQFYIRKVTGVGRTLFAASLVGILVVGAIAGGNAPSN
jgi:hypothetical protein